MQKTIIFTKRETKNSSISDLYSKVSKLNENSGELKNSSISVVPLFILLYATMILTGITETAKAITLPAIKANFGISYLETGNLVSMTTFAYVGVCFFASIYMKKIGIKYALFTGFLILLTGFLLNLIALSYGMVTIAIMVLTSSFGMFEVGNNALAMKLFTKRTALLFSFMHFFYGFGAIMGPYFAVWVLSIPFVAAKGVSAWRYIYVFLSVLPVILIIILFSAKFNGNSNSSKPSELNDSESKNESFKQTDENMDYNTLSKKLTVPQILKMPAMWFFSIVLGLLVAVELSPVNWGPLYFQDIYGLPPETDGARFVSVFYLFFTGSRLFFGFVIEKIGYYRSLIICIILSIGLLTLGFSLGPNGITIIPISGLFISQFWILIVSIANKRFKEEAGMISAIIITVVGLIIALTQILVGYINEISNGIWGFRFSIIFASLALCLVILGKKILLGSAHDFKN